MNNLPLSLYASRSKTTLLYMLVMKISDLSYVKLRNLNKQFMNRIALNMMKETNGNFSLL